jgi:mannan endo-1,4-beta-mannosidase
MKLVAFSTLAMLLFGCADSRQVEQAPVNPNATKETVALYQNLYKLTDSAVLFGHQDDLAYGVGWAYEPGNSDVKKISGDYPALYGWELGNLELDSAKTWTMYLLKP